MLTKRWILTAHYSHVKKLESDPIVFWYDQCLEILCYSECWLNPVFKRDTSNSIKLTHKTTSSVLEFSHYLPLSHCIFARLKIYFVNKFYTNRFVFSFLGRHSLDCLARIIYRFNNCWLCYYCRSRIQDVLLHTRQSWLKGNVTKASGQNKQTVYQEFTCSGNCL